MANTTGYTRGTSFTDAQAAAPSNPLSGPAVDAEYDRIKIALDSIAQSLDLIQRDDGALASGSVGVEQIAPEVYTGLNPAVQWASGQNYTVNDAVLVDDGSSVVLYRCLVSHASSVFSTDLANGKWLELADFTPPAVVGTVPIASGGTGATTAADARTNLGLGALAVLNTLGIAEGGTGATTAAAARAALGVTIGSQVQAYADILQALASLGITADKLVYGTGANTVSLTDFTAFARSLLDDANATAARATLGVSIGSQVQAYSAVLQALASAAWANGDIPTWIGGVMTRLGAGNQGAQLRLNDAGTALEWGGWRQICVAEIQSSGTSGGTFTSGSYVTRTLNTARTNNIVGASLASNQITLPAGTYEIFAKAPGYRCGVHKAKLYNVTDAADQIIGLATSSDAGGFSVTHAELCGRFTITGTKAFEIRHRCGTTRSTDGLGLACSFGDAEHYTTAVIYKVN